jgi:putative DNA primase/helicase
VASPPDDRITASIVEWGEGIAGTARDMLAIAETSQKDGAASAFEEAKDFLREVLSVGPISANEVFRQAAEVGIARRTLTRAKADVGVETKRSGGTGASGHWEWSLPDLPKDAKKPKDASPERLATLDNLGILSASEAQDISAEEESEVL